jgi:pimeloyl-ACP methyl ester carboxylesterase
VDACRGWVSYSGWGNDEHREHCSSHRVAEVLTSLRMLRAIDTEGVSAGALVSSAGAARDGASVLAALQGRLDTACVTVAGHSYGAGTAAAVAGAVADVHCAILLDPWYPAIPAAARMTSWPGERGDCPLLVIGSHAFNKPQSNGNLICEGPVKGLQDAVLGACARAAGQHGGRGAILAVPHESQHSLVDDLGARFFDRCEEHPVRAPAEVLSPWLSKQRIMYSRNNWIQLYRYSWLISILTGRRRTNSLPGAKMADLCVNSALAFIVNGAPLPETMRKQLAAELGDRWGHTENGEAPLPDLLGADQCDMLRWQAKIFQHPGPGVAVLRAYDCKSGDLIVNDVSSLATAAA